MTLAKKKKVESPKHDSVSESSSDSDEEVCLIVMIQNSNRFILVICMRERGMSNDNLAVTGT